MNNNNFNIVIIGAGVIGLAIAERLSRQFSNILVIDNEDKTTKIVFPVAKSLLDVTQNQDILNLADKVDKLLKAAFDNID